MFLHRVAVTVALWLLSPVFGADAPAPPPNFGFLPCSICYETGTIMTDPGATIPAGTIDFIDTDMSCITVELMAQTASFSIIQCGAIGAAATICGCQAPSTMVPGAPVMTPPTVVVTPAPAPAAPVMAPSLTSAPAVAAPVAEAPIVPAPPPPAPTAAPPPPAPIAGRLKITLNPVTGNMTPDVVTVYQQVLTQVYGLALGNIGVTNVSVVLWTQNLTVIPPPAPAPTPNVTAPAPTPSNTTTPPPPTANTTNTTARMIRYRELHTDSRQLQNGTAPTPSPPTLYYVATIVNVTGITSNTTLLGAQNTSNNTAFSILMVNVTNVEAVNSLILSGLKAGSPYFANVTTMMAATPPVPAPAPAPAPKPTGSSDSLSNGAKGGIAVAAIAAGAVVLLICYYANLPKKEEEDAKAKSRYVPTTSSSQVVAVRKSVAPKFTFTNTRSITAPPGKLGIVIDKSIDGPHVKRMNDDSPLVPLGLLVGDKILLIDDLNTDGLSSADISKYMADHGDQPRILRVCTPVSNIRTVNAPAGPLGITIDKGATIKQVKDGSAMADLLFAGETIMTVDGTDVTNMTPGQLSEFLRERADRERVLTICKAPPGPTYEMVTVVAPPGKLGIVIERSTTAEGGPMIKRINETSPLFGKLNPGDQIISVDNDDMTAMTSSAIAEYLSQKIEAPARTFVVKRKVPDGEELLQMARQPKYQNFTVIAPPGKLGIVIERSGPGPMIKRISETSPMIGKLVEGDQIMKIDDLDMKGMTSSSIAEYLSKNIEAPVRTFIVKRLMPDDATAAAAPTGPVTVTSVQEFVIVAPPGKLGIVLERTNIGPKIKSIHESSPLKDQLQVGDAVKKIDELDATGMTSSQIADYLIKNNNNERTIVVARIVTTVVEPEVVAEPEKMMTTTKEEEIVIMAPTGKLGMVIERTAKGPVIKTLHDSSPLKDKVLIGDTILLIDDQNAKAMSSSQIADYLIKNADKERKLTIMRVTTVEVPVEAAEEAPVVEEDIPVTATPAEEEEKEEVKEDDEAAPPVTDILVDNQEHEAKVEETTATTTTETPAVETPAAAETTPAAEATTETTTATTASTTTTETS